MLAAQAATGTMDTKGESMAVLHYWLFAALMLTSGSALTQQMYRWKDASGTLQISGQPPPSSCTTADCNAIREQVDKKATEAKRARLEEVEKARLAKAQQATQVLSAKASLLACGEARSKCEPKNVKADIRLVALVVGKVEVRRLLGTPDKEQSTEGATYGSAISYEYYRLGGGTIQLVWQGTVMAGDLIAINEL